MAANPERLRQRADLTFKQNHHHGRHGWLRLTPAYSVRLVDQLIAEYGEDTDVVFDPFSGTGTTALCAAYQGKKGLATDINPFLIWLATAKAAGYSAESVRLFRLAARQAAAIASDSNSLELDVPPLSNIERWWKPSPLKFLLKLRRAIDECSDDSNVLLRVAFCRTMIKLSNAAFNHQSMSFKAPETAQQASMSFGDESGSFAAQFLTDAEVVAAAATDNPSGEAKYVLADARSKGGCEQTDPLLGKIDLLITSPPYVNRMSYIRELRPYMYWLQFLSNARQAGELDWEAIGGTWGIATSRLTDWVPQNQFVPTGMQKALDVIRTSHDKNGPLLANYVHKYFEDMFTHLEATVRFLRKGATVHYIIGNSIFYGQMVAAESYLAEQMSAVGLRRVQVTPIRKRNSKKNLVEFQVSASKE